MDIPVKKSLLILSATPASLIPAENFLVNRDWTVHATTDMKTALAYVVNERPQFVMVSVEHTDKKILSLPRLLKQTYPDMCVIVFAESTSLDSYRLLAQAGGAYRVHPPITGPAIERAVHKYVRELNEKKQAENLIELSKRRTQAKQEAELSRVAWQVRGGKAADKNLLSKVTGKALEQIVDRGDGKVRRAIAGPTTNVACIVLESEQFSGYLIAATGGDDPLDPRFVVMIRERLCKFLRDNGQDVRDRVSFPLKIREVPFETWALDYAEFMKKTVHRGQELAFAFFPVAEVSSLVLNANDKSEMAQVRIQDIDTEKPVPFDVHLFLAANQRHILYTPKNGRLYPEQKQRLQNAGVEHLHIKKDEAEAFLRYRAELNVESLLERFAKDRPSDDVPEEGAI